MFFYKMEHRGGFKEAAETAVVLSDFEFLGLLKPDGAYKAGFTTWLIMCHLPKSEWRF